MMKGIFRIITTNLKIPEAEMLKSFEHFKYPEKTVSLGSMGKLGFGLLKGALDGDKKAFSENFGRFAAFCKENPSEATNIFRTQDIRGYFKNIMADKEKRQRMSQLLTSETGRAALSGSLDTPEGINLLGYLFNTNDGRKFMSEMLMNSDMVGAFKTVKLILNKQGAYTKKISG
jgi:hypothetical protein